MDRRITSRLILAAAAAPILALAAKGHATDYRFVRVADTRDGPFDFDAGRKVSLNNAGTVAFWRQNTIGSGPTGLFLGSGGAPAPIATNFDAPLSGYGILEASINDSGQIAFYAVGGAASHIFRADPGGTITLLASSGAGTFDGLQNRPSINNSGIVAFRSGVRAYLNSGAGNAELYGPTVPVPGVGVSTEPYLNNVGEVSLVGTYGLAVGGFGHLRGSGGPPTIIADGTSTITTYFNNSVNDSGLVLFGASTPMGLVLFRGFGGGGLINMVDTLGPYANLPMDASAGFGSGGDPTQNNVGSIAFSAQLDSGPVGLYTGADPDASRVVQAGSTLFGREFRDLYGGLSRKAINDKGEIAFQATLLDTFGYSSVVVKAVPSVAMKWEDDSDGVWSDDGNWQGPVPNDFYHDANFTDAITAPRTVTVDGAFNVGSMNFDNPNSYTIGGSGTITLDDSYRTTVNLISGTHYVNAALRPARDLDLFVASGARLEASNLQPSTHEINKNGDGELHVNRVVALVLHVNAGTVSVMANGSDGGVSRVGTITIAGAALSAGTGGFVDLDDNDLLVTATSFSTVFAQVVQARNGGAWDSPGITSTAAREQSSGATTLGVMHGYEYESIYGAGASFGPFNVSSPNTVVKYTWYGDADFNGVVDFDDYVRTDAGFNNGWSGWINGDFDLNGAVDFDDYVLIDLGFNSQSGTLRRALDYLDGTDRNRGDMSDPALEAVVNHFDRFGTDYAGHFLAAVPEPVGLLAACLPALACTLRRRGRCLRP